MKKLLLFPIFLFIFSCSSSDGTIKNTVSTAQYFSGTSLQNENGYLGTFNFKINIDNTVQQNQSILNVITDTYEMDGILNGNIVTGKLRVSGGIYGTYTATVTNNKINGTWHDTVRNWTGTFTSTP